MAKQDNETIFRYTEIDLTKIDRAARTIPISFSSEWPALQMVKTERVAKLTGLKVGEVFIEVLDHSPGNVDLSLLNNRGAFLDEHEEKDQLGVIEKAEIKADERRGYSIVRLGTDDHAQKRFDQMEKNIRPHVSAGYKYTRYLGQEDLPNGRKAHRFAWKGTEISSVATPNDPTVGVGMGVARNYQDLPEIDLPTKEERKISQIKIMTPEEIAAAKAEIAAGKAALAAERSQIEVGATNKDKERRAKIHLTATKIAEQYSQSPEAEKLIRKLAQDADLGGNSPDEFSNVLLDSLKDIRKLETTSANIGLSKKEAGDFKITRALKSCFENQGKIANDCPEFDYHQEASKKYGRSISTGFIIPADVTMGTKEQRNDGQRDLQVNVFGQGGAFVPTTIQTPIIEILRNKMVTREAGIQVIGGLTGNVSIPRQTGAATAYSLSEIALLTLSTQTIDQIVFSPKRAGVTNNYSKQLVIQSSVDVENFMRNDMMEVLAIYLDFLVLNGNGANSQPTGIVNIPGVGSITFGGAATYANLVLFETTLNAANALLGNRRYITSPLAKGKLKSAAKFLTGGGTNVTNIALWEDDEINGYPALDTNQILNNQMIYGNFSDYILGLFGGIDVVVDPYTLAKNAEVAITTNAWIDGNARHAQSFCVSADAANQ